MFELGKIMVFLSYFDDKIIWNWIAKEHPFHMLQKSKRNVVGKEDKKERKVPS